MKISILFLSSILLLTGCASPETGQRVALDSLATTGGGAAAYFAGNHDPALTTAGAVGGFVVSEAFQAMARSGRQKAYNSGLEEGKAMGQEQIIKGLWEESNGLPKNNRRNYQTLSLVLSVPSRSQGSVIYDTHFAPSITPQPEKILIQDISATNHVSYPHYEKFQIQE